MKTYAIYAQMVEEPVCYVEAENIDDLIRMMNERSEKGEPFGMFPGWNPIKISKKKMYEVLNRLNYDDFNLVDEDKKGDFALFARMQFDDSAILEKLKKYRMYKQKYNVNLTENDIEKIKRDYALYQKKLSKIIERLSEVANNVKGELFHLADLACLDEWEEWSENKFVDYDLKEDRANLRRTGDNNINFLIEILDKIMELRKYAKID